MERCYPGIRFGELAIASVHSHPRTITNLHHFTVNVLDAKHATFNCNTFRDAFWMQFLQSIFAANFFSQIGNFYAQTLQLFTSIIAS